MRAGIALTIAVAVSSCSAVEDKGAVEAQVTAFHVRYDKQQFAAVYRDAAPAFKGTAPQARFLEFMRAVHRKLGAVRSTQQQSWRANYGTGGATVTMVYATDFVHGKGVETFVYQTEPKPRLQGYNIASDALVLR